MYWGLCSIFPYAGRFKHGTPVLHNPIIRERLLLIYSEININLLQEIN